MEVKPGYKQTEVGVIPKDWTVRPLGVLATTVASGRSKVGSAFGDYAVYGSTGVIGYSDSADYEGDAILVARVGANAGKLNLVSGRYGVTDNTIIVRLSTELCLPFFWRQLESKRLNSLVFGSGQPLITGTQLKSLTLCVPSPLEQRAIAGALSDVDALIGALDQLIAKKRDLKQATMQQLLTGQTRLPGFHGEWEVKQLVTVCAMKSGEGITNANIDGFSKYPCYGGNGLRGFTSRFTHNGGHALIGRQGALCGNVLGVEGMFFASEHAIVVTAFPQTDIRWLTYILGKMNLNQYSESSAQPGLSVAKLLNLDLPVPPSKAEQTAIAEVLSDMDAELAALEQRRDKTRALKQGMMQELLTGRIRLIN